MMKKLLVLLSFVVLSLSSAMAADKGAGQEADEKAGQATASTTPQTMTFNAYFDQVTTNAENTQWVRDLDQALFGKPVFATVNTPLDIVNCLLNNHPGCCPTRKRVIEWFVSRASGSQITLSSVPATHTHTPEELAAFMAASGSKS